jgi:hypothetical protein
MKRKLKNTIRLQSKQNSALENLHDNGDINRAWDAIREEAENLSQR